MPIKVWIERREHIPGYAKILKIPIEELTKRFDDADADHKLCIFSVDVTYEQHTAIMNREYL